MPATWARALRIGVMCATLFIAAVQAQAPERSIAITDVTVIDPDGSPPVRVATLRIVGDKIESVLPADVAHQPAAETIDGAGRFLIPGLWDSHVHVVDLGDTALPLFLAYGVTGVRDVGSAAEAVLRLRAQTSSGELAGPRIITSGPLLHGGEEHSAYALLVNTPEDAKQTVRRLHDLGVDFVKVHDNLSAAAYRAILKEARSLGLRVVGHVTPPVTVWDAIRAGQTGIEHSLRIPLALSGEEIPLRAKAAKHDSEFFGYLYADQAASRAPALARERRLSDELRVHGIALCPTLTDMRALSTLTSQALRSDERFALLPKSLQQESLEFYDALAKSPAERAAYSELFRYALLWVGRFHEAGVVILAGTDARSPGDFPGSDLHSELELLVSAGLSPLEALRSATVEPQVFHHLVAPGPLIAPGKAADLVLLAANPLDDIRASRSIELVVRRGHVFRPADLKWIAHELQQQRQ